VSDSFAGAPAVAVRGLAKRYADRAVLDDVSFEVAAGEIVALLGPNGAGKTTTVEIVEGYRHGDTGMVRVLGEDPSRAGPALRARIGLMLQGGGLEPRAQALELLRLYAALIADPLDPDEVLDRLGLRAVAGTPVRRLSGGERQRLGLGLAIVGRPEVAILDEPTAGMDPEARATTRDLVHELARDGVAVLLTTHDLDDVERLADRVLILHGGRIVADGPPATVAAGARPRIVVRFGAPVAVDAAKLGPLPGGATLVPLLGDAAGAVVPDAEPSPELVAAIAAAAAARGWLITELRAGTASLEERYLELTGDRSVGRTVHAGPS
jgi:ABC-2 type transport system ATP-binding protein